MDVYGLIGNPVGHSLSPVMHEAAYDELGLDAAYVTFEPAPDHLRTAIDGAAALGISGLNVTIPFKQDVLDQVLPDETAADIGAVNTISFEDDRVRGYNTDAAGARRALSHHGVDPSGKQVVMVGAGGAARAIGYVLARAGSHLHVANRTVERAEELASFLDASAHGLPALPELVPEAEILINATSVGMEEDRTPVPPELLHGDLTVMDIVYTPLETTLLTAAERAGARTIDGAWMLLYQGVAAFEVWTGRTAPVDAMNRALRSGLGEERS
ncbi:MAG: shikimate dehydrogenase [Halodesulfurarchaeum sp.]